MTGTSALAHYLNVLRRSAWLIVLITALCATGATYLSARKEKLYSASSDAFLSSQNLGCGSRCTATLPASMKECRTFSRLRAGTGSGPPGRWKLSWRQRHRSHPFQRDC